MAKTDLYQFDSTAGNNTDINSIDIAESCNPSGINNAIRQFMAYARDFTKTVFGAASSSGTNTITLTTAMTITAYADGMAVGFIAGGTNTGNTTLNVDSVGAKKVFRGNDSELSAGDITQNMPCLLFYDASADSASGAWKLLNPLNPPSAPNFTTIELGHASDTTLARVSAGLISVEGDTVALLTATQTMTNKTLTAPTINGTVATTGLTLPAFTLSGAVAGADQQVSRVNLKDYGEVTQALGDLGGGTDDIDVSAGNSVTATVSTATQTFTFSNPTASDELCSFTLRLTNGGSQTVNWPASVDWAGGAAPTLTASGVDVLEFWTQDGGTTWYGALVGADFQ